MRALVFSLLFILCAVPARAGLKIYYLRHAESGANAAYAWKDQGVPRDQWPPYVGHADTFSPKGEAQARAVTGKLQGRTFDFIAVSPIWRARHTILPYLRATGQKGEIWPELAETEGDIRNLLRQGRDPEKLPPPSPGIFTGGKPVSLPDDEKENFTLRPEAATLNKLGKGPRQQAADRNAIVERAVHLLRTRFGGSGKTILLVGHGNAGRLLAHALTGDPGVLEEGRHIENTRLWMAEEQPDGTFRLEIYNDSPWKQTATRPHPGLIPRF